MGAIALVSVLNGNISASVRYLLHSVGLPDSEEASPSLQGLL
jgi:hypothetical protein